MRWLNFIETVVIAMGLSLPAFAMPSGVVVLVQREGQSPVTCMGVIVDKNLVMTSDHCVDAKLAQYWSFEGECPIAGTCDKNPNKQQKPAAPEEDEEDCPIGGFCRSHQTPPNEPGVTLKSEPYGPHAPSSIPANERLRAAVNQCLDVAKEAGNLDAAKAAFNQCLDAAKKSP